MHDLLRSYGRERCAEEDRPLDRVSVVRRVAAGYVSLGSEAEKRIGPLGLRVRGLNFPVWSPPDFEAAALLGDPLQWFAREQNALISLTKQAAQLGLSVEVIQLVNTLPLILELQGHFDTLRELVTLALRAADEVGNEDSRAALLWILGKCSGSADCRQSLEAALSLFEQLGDRRGAGWALHELGTLCIKDRQFIEAQNFLRQSVEIFSEIGDSRSLASARVNLGDAYMGSGQRDIAMQEFEEGSRLFVVANDLRGEAYALRNLGVFYRESGDFSESIRVLERSRSIFGSIGDRRWEANAWLGVGNTYLRQADVSPLFLKEAINAYEQYRQICSELGNFKGVAEASAQLAEAYFRQGNNGAAVAAARRSLTWFESQGAEPEYRHWRATVLKLLAVATLKKSEDEARDAQDMLRLARRLFEEFEGDVAAADAVREIDGWLRRRPTQDI